MLEEMGEFIQSRLSAIDYIMIGGALGEEDIIEMMVEDREGVDIPSDHKLVWAHIAGRGIKCDEGRQGAHRVAWDYKNPLHLDVVDRYLRRMGDKTIPDEAPPSLESFYPPWVAGIDLPQSRCCGFFVSFINKHK